MRLGVVGMLPADFREIGSGHLEAIQDLNLSGAAFHAPGEELLNVQAAECEKVKKVYAKVGMDLPQFGIGFSECLFDYDPEVRALVLHKIKRGIEIARELNAQTCLIRTGSLNPDGSYTPCRENFKPDSKDRLIESLRAIASKAEEEGVPIVIETHALTIMGSPEINKEVITEVGSSHMGVVMDYVNHFQSLEQVYNSSDRLNHIFDLMGEIAPVGHCKDIRVRSGLVVHLDEAMPGEGELDLETALRRWHNLHSDGYMLLEHLSAARYPQAAANVQGICAAASIEIH